MGLQLDTLFGVNAGSKINQISTDTYIIICVQLRNNSKRIPQRRREDVQSSPESSRSLIWLPSSAQHHHSTLCHKCPYNSWPTILVALHLSKAFNTVNRATLLEDIEQSTLPPELNRWPMNYLTGRQSSVLFRGQKSELKRIK